MLPRAVAEEQCEFSPSHFSRRQGLANDHCQSRGSESAKVVLSLSPPAERELLLSLSPLAERELFLSLSPLGERPRAARVRGPRERLARLFHHTARRSADLFRLTC